MNISKSSTMPKQTSETTLKNYILWTNSNRNLQDVRAQIR